MFSFSKKTIFSRINPVTYTFHYNYFYFFPSQMKKAILALLAFSAFDSVQSTNTGRQLLTNGNFSDNHCGKHHYCIFKSSTFVSGWNPIPEGEIGFGKYYNKRLGTERVIELATKRNVCIAQTVRNLQPGVYQLKYNYAARDKKRFSDSEFEVRFNDRQIRNITPCDYNRNTDVIEFEVRDQCEGQVKFCGTSKHQSRYGALIGQVSLIRKGNLPYHRPSVIHRSTTPQYPQYDNQNLQQIEGYSSTKGIESEQQNQGLDQASDQQQTQGYTQDSFNQGFDGSQTLNNQILNPAFNYNQGGSNLRTDFNAQQYQSGPTNNLYPLGNR